MENFAHASRPHPLLCGQHRPHTDRASTRASSPLAVGPWQAKQGGAEGGAQVMSTNDARQTAVHHQTPNQRARQRSASRARRMKGRLIMGRICNWTMSRAILLAVVVSGSVSPVWREGT